MADRTPEEIVAAIEAELRDQPMIGDTTGSTVELVTDRFRITLDRVLSDMGYAERERVSLCASVSAEVDGDAIVVTYEAPERVRAYFDALESDEWDRATLVLRAREG